MEHDARSVANELIRRAHDAGRDITPMQVLKLAYYCHAWMLGLYHRPLLEQPIEAWRYGPIVPELYRSLRRYGGEPVRRPIDLESAGVTERPYDPSEVNIINQVSEKYGPVSGNDLSAMAHAIGTPWHQVWSKHRRDVVIPDPIIEDYYAQQLESAKRNGQR